MIISKILFLNKQENIEHTFYLNQLSSFETKNHSYFKSIQVETIVVFFFFHMQDIDIENVNLNNIDFDQCNMLSM